MTEDERREAERQRLVVAAIRYAEKSLLNLIRAVSVAEDEVAEALDHIMIYDESRERVLAETMRAMAAAERLKGLVAEEIASIGDDFRKRLDCD